MTKEVLILKHVANEGGGTIADFLEKEKIPFRFVELYNGEKLPGSVDNLRAVCIMGGPMNVYDEDKHPFLSVENTFIQKLIQMRIPCLGVCLGSQLIVKAMGGKVLKAAQPEIGWQAVRLTDAAKKDPLFSNAPFPLFQVLQWHEDTFTLPEGFVLLATNDVVPHQAYRSGESVYGLQFHVEVDRPMLEDWFKKREDLPSILSFYDSYRAELTSVTDKIYKKFFSF